MFLSPSSPGRPLFRPISVDDACSRISTPSSALVCCLHFRCPFVDHLDLRSPCFIATCDPVSSPFPSFFSEIGRPENSVFATWVRTWVPVICRLLPIHSYPRFGFLWPWFGFAEVLPDPRRSFPCSSFALSRISTGLGGITGCDCYCYSGRR